MKHLRLFFLSLSVILIISCDTLFGDKEPVPYMYNFIKVPVPSNGITFPIGYDDDDTATVSRPFYISETEVTERLYDIVAKWAATEKESGKYYNLYYEHYPYFGEDQYRDIPVWREYAQRWTDWFGGAWIDLDNVRSAQIWCNAFTEWYNEQNNTQLGRAEK
jgi:hypothetical protein